MSRLASLVSRCVRFFSELHISEVAAAVSSVLQFRAWSQSLAKRAVNMELKSGGNAVSPVSVAMTAPNS